MTKMRFVAAAVALARDEAWAKTPKPKVTATPPQDIPNAGFTLWKPSRPTGDVGRGAIP